MTGRDGVPTEFFHAIYAGAQHALTPRPLEAPWDVGRAQPDVDALLAAGELRGRVLDLGTGPGHNAVAIARAGAAVVAVDLVPAAVERARAAAAEAGVVLEFAVADALDLTTLGRRFDAVLDSGTFHVFSDADRVRYATSVASVLEPGGRLFLLCFSDEQPPGPGPRHVPRAEIQATFAAPAFEVERITRTRFLTRGPDGGAVAWLAKVRRV
jgi:SAM-dependent methyltransferase